MTLRTRIAIAAALGVLIVLTLVSGALFWVFAADVRARVDSSLVDAANQANAVAEKIKQTSQTGSAPDFSTPITIGSVDVQLFLSAADVGTPSSFGPLDSRDAAVSRGTAPAYFENATRGGRSYRVYTAPYETPDGLVRTSRAADADDGTLGAALALLAALTLAATAATYVSARLTAGRVLRPVAALTAAAEHVTLTHDLTARLGGGGTDEVGRLSASFDAMLAALEDSVAAQQQLVSDASHELRTPLTSLIMNLELLEDGAGLSDPEAPAFVRSAREQAGELDRLITDLIDLARYEESRVRRESVRLDLLTMDAVRRRPATPGAAAIACEVSPCVVRVDPVGVEHAIGNLLDNAQKWSPHDVRVVVAGGSVSVSDRGPGIDAADLPRIFDRFYRAPSARAMPGSGLGLSIVGSVARANGGTISVDTGPSGSTFTLSFPVDADTGMRD